MYRIVYKYYIYFHVIKSFTIGPSDKISYETSENDRICPLNVFYWNE